MTVDITQEELDLFTKNGISQDDIKQTINNYRSDGLSDIDIRAKFDNKLKSFRGQKSGYTYPNQDVKNMNPEEFKRNVDTLYNIPQVPIPQRGTLVNSDGVPMETVGDVLANNVEPSKKTFVQSHPVIASTPEALKQLGTRAVKSFPEFGVGVNDLVSLVGDKTGLQGLSDFGRSNAQYWQEQSNKIQIDPKYQGLKGLQSKETVLPTVLGSIADQASNLLFAGGGGAAGAKAAAGLGLKGAAKAGLITAGTSVPNLAQEGQYLDKIEAFKNIYGRVPTEEELRVIQNVAMGEKATNAALETISDKLLFGKLFPQGVTTKGVKDVLKNAGKQALTEAGTEGLQEGVSIGAESLLGINQGNNLERLADSMAIGGITGGVMGGVTSASAQPYDTQFVENQTPVNPVEALKEVSAQILDNGKAIYDSANQQSGFDALKQLSKEGAYTNPSVEEIAPNTYKKQQAKQAPVVKKWDIEALPHITNEEAQNVKNWDIEALPRVKSVEEQIAPKTAAKQQAKALEKAEKTEEARNSVVENIAPNTANKEVVDVDAKIAELERKFKLVGGEKTLLGQKYQRQIEELRGTQQAIEPVTEEIKPVENVPSKTEEAPKAEPKEEISVTETDKNREVILNNLEKAKNTLEMVKKQGGDTTVAENVVKRAQNNLDEYDKLSEATKPAEAQEVKSVEKPKNVSKNTKIKVKKDDYILASDEYYSDGNYIVKKSKFTLEGKNTETKNLPNEQANMLWERYANNPTIELKPTNRTWEGKQLKAVEYEYTDKNGDIQKIYLPKQNSDMFKGYDLAVSEYKASNYDEKFDIVLVKDGDEVVGFVSELGGRAKKNIVETPDNFVDTEIQKQKKVDKLKQAKEEKAGRPVIKYSVKVDKNNNITGTYMENDVMHTDGNSVYYNKYVMPDKTGVQKVTPLTEGPLKTVNKMLETTANYTTKLEDIGKIAISKNPVRGQKIRVFEADINGKKQQVFLNEKYLLDKKNLELYANDVEPQFNAISIRRNGEQIGLVMPIINSNVESLVDVPKMKVSNTTSAVKPSSKQQSKKTEKSTKTIEDSGEFLMGNKKVDKNGLTWEDLEGMNKLLRDKNTTKAKIYPKPSMDDLKAEGYTEFQSALIQNIYNKINAKPAAGYEGEVNQKLYVDTVNDVMNTVKKYIKEHSDEFTTDLVAEATRAYRSWSYKYNKSLFDAVFPDTENKVGQYGSVFRQYPEYNRKAIIIGGNKFIGSLQLDTRTLKDVMTTLEDSKLVKEKGAKAKLEGWEKQFTILEPSRWNNEYRVGIKKGRSKGNVLDKKFNTKEEAEAYAKKMYEVYQEHKKRDIDIRGTRNAVERRENNKDVTSDEVREAFGFKGVNFGNWVKQSERQDFLNIAYDSLLDLAEIINVPAKAISLNGNLGLAFGAQGHGGRAAAHYLPAYKEINLTRMSGSGSLAHEWWHAVDNYFADMAKNEEYSGKFALELKESGKLRPEVFEAFENLSKQIKTAPFTEEELQKRKDAIVARCERNIKYYADTVKDTFKKVDGVAEFVDKLVKNKDKYIKMSDEDMHNLVWKDFAKLIPEKRQTIENMSKLTWLTGEIQRIGKAEEIAMKTPQKSKYLQAAERLNGIDTGMGGGYWTEDTELGARAFASYILDKLEKQSVKNEFLTRKDGGILDLEAWSKSGESVESAIVPTYPADSAERERIFSAFDKLFNTIKTRETEKGVELYSIEVPSWMNNYKYSTQGYKNIDLETLNDLIAKGCTQDELQSVLPSDLQPAFRNIEGYKFYNLKNSTRGIQFGGNVKRIGINLSMVGNNPRRFVNTLIHELEHADQEAYYNYLKGKDHLTTDEIDYIEAYEENEKLNHEIQVYLIKNKTKIDNIVNPFIKKHINLSEEDFYNEISNIKNKSKRDIIIKHIEYLGKYFNLFREIGAYQEGMKYSEVYIDEEREIQQGIDGRNKSVKNSSTNRNIGAAIRARFKGRNGNYAIGEPTKGTQELITKERGAIKTLNKYDKEMADAVTEKEYEVRSLDKVAEEVRNMSEKELDDVLNSDRSSDTKSLALAQSIKSSIDNGEVPVTKLNKWAVEGTDIGQAMQARKAIAPETVEEAVIKMHTYNTENVKPAVKKLINDSDKIVKEMTNEEIEKQFNEWLAKQDETPAKKQYSQYGDRLALLKAMERYRNTKERQKIREFQRNEERKRKAVERLVNERLKNSYRKVRADLIDNILKLENNDGLTSDNVAKLIMKMFKVKTVSPADVAELKKLSSKIKNASTQRDEDVAKAMMQKYIIDNSIGSSAWDKISAIRYINMLGGTTQRFLDFVSTGVYQVVRLGDNFVTMVIDKTASKVLGTEEVTSGFYAPEYYQGFIQGAQEGYFDTIQGINTGRAGETARYDLNKPNAFRYRPLKTKKGLIAKSLQGVENAFSVAEKITNGMIKIPDRAYFQARYNTSLLDQLNSRGVNTKRFQKLKGATLSETLTNIAKPEEVEQAILEARENVFQRECTASYLARGLRNLLNRITPYQIGDWALPFIHTTSVISEDIIDRIGVGLIKGSQKIIDIRKNGGSSSDLRDAYNSIAKSIIGMGIIALGAAKGEDEEKSYTDKEITGEYSNTVNIKNVSINAKNIPFILVPYNLGKMLMSNDEQKIKKAVLKTWEAIAETNPVLSKYNEISKKNKFGNKDEKDILDEFIADTLGVPLAQLFQNATLRNIRNITDEYDRETYVPNNKWATLGNKFKNATPGLSQTLPKKYNAIGEEVKRNNIDNPLEKAVSAFITGHKRLKPENETYNEFKKIGKSFENTDYKGKGNIAMAKIKRGVKVNGENYKMSPEEYSNFQRDYGRINYYFRKVLSDSSFMNKDAKSFVDDISEIKQSAEEAVKINQLGHIPSKYKNGRYRLHKYTEYMLKNYDVLTQ